MKGWALRMTGEVIRTALGAIRMTFWTFLPVLAALAGCDPEPLPTSFDVESGGQEVVTIDFGVMGYDNPAATKAYSSDVEDGLVDRIDIFMYDSNGWIYGHKVIGEYGGGALDLSKVTFVDSGAANEVRTYLIMANLDPDSAQYVGYLDKVDMNRYPETYIPWSAGNARVNYPLMAATAKVTFGSTTSVSVSLMRYMSKIEIGTVTAKFWGDPDLFRNVYLQNIVFANAWDIVRICQRKPQNFTGSPSDIFGPKGTSSSCFGNPSYHYYMANYFLDQDEWSTYNKTYADMHGTYNQGTWGGKGKLKQDYNYLYNDNWKQPKHTINLTAPAALVALSQQTWDTNAYLPKNAGKLCDEYEGSLGPLSVNRAFYTLPTKFNAWFEEPTYGDESQNNELRLVLAVKINGTLYFYSKMIRGLNPNMCYRINNITLAGEPSEYPNTWVRGGQVTKSRMPDQAGYDEVWRIHGNVAEIDDLVL